MKSNNRFIFAFLGAGLTLGFSGLIFHMIFNDVYLNAGECVYRFNPIDEVMSIGILVEMARGVLFAYLYPSRYGTQELSKSQRGWMYGAILGLFSGLPWLLLSIIILGIDHTWVYLDAGFFVIQGALAGTVVSLIYGKPVEE